MMTGMRLCLRDESTPFLVLFGGFSSVLILSWRQRGVGMIGTLVLGTCRSLAKVERSSRADSRARRTVVSALCTTSRSIFGTREPFEDEEDFRRCNYHILSK